MPRTIPFVDIVMARAERDPEFRIGLFHEAIKALLSDDFGTAKVLLRDYLNATVGSETFAEEMEKNLKRMTRMLSDEDDPRVDDLFAMVARLKQREGDRGSIPTSVE